MHLLFYTKKSMQCIYICLIMVIQAKTRNMGSSKLQFTSLLILSLILLSHSLGNFFFLFSFKFVIFFLFIQFLFNIKILFIYWDVGAMAQDPGSDCDFVGSCKNKADCAKPCGAKGHSPTAVLCVPNPNGGKRCCCIIA